MSDTRTSSLISSRASTQASSFATSTKQLVVLDNYDSFTYNLVHCFREILQARIDVFRNDEVSIAEISKYKKIVLSPGPGIPKEAGIMPELVSELGATHSILGVCLGHQCIGEVYGARLRNLEKVLHGKEVHAHVRDSREVLFSEVPEVFESGRYHSWVVSRDGFPDCLKITADDEAGNIMALRHKEYDVAGVQFHPESVLTPCGKKMLENWLKS